MAAAVTRFVIGATDPVTIAVFRFGLGFLFLLPVALVLRSRWPRGRDWFGVAALGIMFYGVFFVVYAESLVYTTAARGSLAVSTLPLLTMIVAAALGREALSGRKTIGVLVAMGGVAVALAAGLAEAPPEAWRGDLIMLGGMLSMALYNVLSRPLMARSSPLGYACAGMAFGVGAQRARRMASGRLRRRGRLRAGAVGGHALPRHRSPARLASTCGCSRWSEPRRRASRTPSRSARSQPRILAAVLIGEPIGLSLIIGIAAVGAGIWIASTERRRVRVAQ